MSYSAKSSFFSDLYGIKAATQNPPPILGPAEKLPPRAEILSLIPASPYPGLCPSDVEDEPRPSSSIEMSAPEMPCFSRILTVTLFPAYFLIFVSDSWIRRYIATEACASNLLFAPAVSQAASSFSVTLLISAENDLSFAFKTSIFLMIFSPDMSDFLACSMRRPTFSYEAAREMPFAAFAALLPVSEKLPFFAVLLFVMLFLDRSSAIAVLSA